MTSNIGSEHIMKAINSDNFNYDKMAMEVSEALKSYVKPEFLNRIDEIIVFEPLNKDQITEIVKLNLKGLKNKVNNIGYAIKISDDAIELIGALSYNPQFGARPVKRFIQKEIENKIAKLIISGDEEKKKTIEISKVNDDIKIDRI